MYYLMIIVSALLFSLQFMLNDGYKRECGSTLVAALKFSLYTSLTGLIILLLINKFKLEVTLFSAIVALVYALVCVIFSYCSVKAFESANLSVYSVFSMIGGMVLPFAYGMLCGEEFKLSRLLCCVLIVAAIIFTADKSGEHKGGFKYYIAIFTLNGLVGILSKYHQSNISLCVDSASFMMLTKIFTLAISAILLLCMKGKIFKISLKALANCGVYSAINSIGNLMLLIALLHLPASVQYPLVTGGTMFFALAISLVRKDKVTKRDILGTALAIVSTIIIIF